MDTHVFIHTFVLHGDADVILNVVFHLVKIGKCHFTEGAVIFAAAHCASLQRQKGILSSP